MQINHGGSPNSKTKQETKSNLLNLTPTSKGEKGPALFIKTLYQGEDDREIQKSKSFN